eukprot:12393763-Prorocentrum_lima.AAC.1
MLPIRLGGLGLQALTQRAPAAHIAAWAHYAAHYRHHHQIDTNPELEQKFPHAAESIQTAWQQLPVSYTHLTLPTICSV